VCSRQIIHRRIFTPHFPNNTPDRDALIGIESLEVIRGHVPATVLKEIKAWAAQNQTLLRQTWRTLNT
jgi:Domain of unknown function (DUF4160)